MALQPSPQKIGNYGSFRQRCSTILLLGALVGPMAACGGGGSGDGTASGSGGGASTAATLTWDPVTAPNLSGYRIYYGTASGTYLQPYGQGIDVGNTTTATITGLSSGARYHFVLTAYNTLNSESGYSNEATKDIP